ncbi:MAG TPA: hypothetical protein VFA99_16270 [Acidobacteriaceae bacterium]|nr:hypothetical protein [Acidobacteriaceae bacterium]
MISASTVAQEVPNTVPPEGGYVKNQNNPRVIIFVHGLWSGSEAWRCEQDKNAWWPAMIAKDENTIFANTDIYVVGYPTPKHGGKMTITDLASVIVNRMKSNGVFSRHKEVIFVAHSLGGLLVEKILLTYHKDAPSEKVKAIFFYGTPHEGSRLANIGRFINSDPLLKELETGRGNLILRDLDQTWASSGFDIKQYCAFEKKPENGAIVVDEYSASRGCIDPIAINENHRDLVKPCAVTADSYTYLENGLRDVFDLPANSEHASSPSPSSPAPPTYADPNQPWSTGAIAPGMGVYFQLTRLHQRLMELQSSWATTIQGIGIQFYQPYKTRQVANPPTVMPDNLQDDLAEQDREYAEQYRNIRPELVKLRGYAIACMQPTPNQLGKDEQEFSKAEHAATKSIPVADLRTDRPDMNRFLFISSYVLDLRNRLGNFHCDAPSH